MEAKVISKENLEKIEELNKMIKFYDLDGKITCKELVSNPKIGISIMFPEESDTSDSMMVELTLDFTDEDVSYKQLVEDLNKEVSKVLKDYRDELMFNIIYGKIGNQIMCKDFEAAMLGDTILITVKL